MPDSHEQILEPNETKPAEKIPAYQHLACGWPLFMLFVGGAVGGMLGGLAYGININISKSKLPIGAKAILNIVTGFSAIAIWMAVAFLLVGDPSPSQPEIAQNETVQNNSAQEESVATPLTEFDPNALTPVLAKDHAGNITLEGQRDGKGNKQGRWTSYHENGYIKEQGEYKNGLKFGKWTRFDNTGRITLEKTYGENEELTNTTNFKDGAPVVSD